jgi:hypothetical protein
MESTTPPATDTPSIVFVHGIKIGPEGPGPIPYIPTKGSDSGWDCNDYWGKAMDFLREHGLGGDLRTIKYYKGDRNCANGNEERYSSDLHDYRSDCTDYPTGDRGSDGTNDESLYHISCLFARYLYQNFGQSNREVIIVAHSMGGIIVRETLYQMQQRIGQDPSIQHPFPPTIGRVTKAITFNSPHGGVPLFPDSAIGCGGCTQSNELYEKSEFMLECVGIKSARDGKESSGLERVGWKRYG